jgi:signal transduction histidine kinase
MDWLFNLFGGEGLAPHGYCLLWEPSLVWTHVLADSLIAAAYFSIPIAIIRFVTRRPDIAFSWVFWLFALFIVACGTTHLVAIWTLWYPHYGFQAMIKVLTAIASVGTAIVLWPLIPRALAIPSPLQLRQANDELARRVAERDDALEKLRREVAERERAEAALVQAQKMEAVGQLTGGIAHDFNNLLQAVSGMLALIARHPEQQERVRHWAEQGLKASERGTRLTGQLLAFSRVQRLDLKPVPVEPMITNMLDLLSRSLGPDVRIATDLQAPGAVVVGDKTQLELALLNLAINARDAMPGGGTVTIGTAPAADQSNEYPDGAIDIVVRDTGSGMPPEVIERAFEPFFTTKGVGKGTGLGLSMVYGVARQSGGSVRIESEVGQGTVVTITLRRAPAAAGLSADPSAESAEIISGNGQTVLVVDDEEGVRTSIADALSSIGYRVVSAGDGAAALRLVMHERPALAILDYAMPGMNGAELASAAKAMRPEMKIVFASGFAESEVLEAIVGPDAAILRKPFTIASLSRLAAQALGTGAAG